MYYIAVSSIGKIGVGESVLLKKDVEFDEISAVRPSGEVIGYVASFPIEGCLSRDFLSGVAHPETGIICDVLLKSGDVVILSTMGYYAKAYSRQSSSVASCN